jgi:hypothetical protein
MRFFVYLLLLTGLAWSLPDDPVSKARRLYRYGRSADSLKVLEPYLKAHPKDVPALMVLADIRLDQHDRAGALAAFEAAESIPKEYRPRAAKTFCDAAVDEVVARRGPRALELADKGLKQEETVNSLFVHGKALELNGNTSGARADFEKAREIALAGKADQRTLDAIEAALKALP